MGKQKEYKAPSYQALQLRASRRIYNKNTPERIEQDRLVTQFDAQLAADKNPSLDNQTRAILSVAMRIIPLDEIDSQPGTGGFSILKAAFEQEAEISSDNFLDEREKLIYLFILRHYCRDNFQYKGFEQRLEKIRSKLFLKLAEQFRAVLEALPDKQPTIDYLKQAASIYEENCKKAGKKINPERLWVARLATVFAHVIDRHPNTPKKGQGDRDYQAIIGIVFFMMLTVTGGRWVTELITGSELHQFAAKIFKYLSSIDKKMQLIGFGACESYLNDKSFRALLSEVGQELFPDDPDFRFIDSSLARHRKILADTVDYIADPYSEIYTWCKVGGLLLALPLGPLGDGIGRVAGQTVSETNKLLAFFQGGNTLTQGVLQKFVGEGTSVSMKATQELGSGIVASELGQLLRLGIGGGGAILGAGLAATGYKIKKKIESVRAEKNVPNYATDKDIEFILAGLDLPQTTLNLCLRNQLELRISANSIFAMAKTPTQVAISAFRKIVRK